MDEREGTILANPTPPGHTNSGFGAAEEDLMTRCVHGRIPLGAVPRHLHAEVERRIQDKIRHGEIVAEREAKAKAVEEAGSVKGLNDRVAAEEKKKAKAKK